MLRRATAARATSLPTSTRLSLALQGGGAFGAFTWGMLDRILEEPAIDFDAVSGASAGAVNGVLVAHGLRVGGREGAREALERFWTALGRDAASSFFRASSRSGLALDLSTRLLSPYQLNPFNLNPLRELLLAHVDFDALRAEPTTRLLISATRVADGSSRIFREDEVSVDVVLASACLPMLHQAVTIDGESYWDGGYAANPPLLPLVEAAKSSRILLVQIVPTSGDDRPTTSPGIVKRISQITFNAALQHELEAISALQRLSAEETVRSEAARRIQALTIDHVSAEDWYPDLSRRSAADLDRSFLTDLHQAGRKAASAWLGEDGSRHAKAAG
ncbi:patatin-like phospholipase family protein [Enterovirga rhinocerotis]|uniref:patatin-like phospholipase family protein n=1 Tax=Enterovirga rhinocerotis TaxID=1339210 RepID=UPI00247A991A|nr:patatin-like phospholipase family protein [Enterovirga rhinocerotis]